MNLLTLWLLLHLCRRPDDDGQGAAGDPAVDGPSAFGQAVLDATGTGCGCCVAYAVLALVLTIVVGTLVTLWNWIAGH